MNPMLWVRLRHEDQGLALITVMWVTAAATALMVSMIALTTGALRSSTAHNNFDSALATAEAGIDDALAQLQADQTVAIGADAPWSTPPSAEDEETWARDQLNAQADAGNLVDSGDGEYAVIRPSNLQTVYAIGWSPDRTAPNAVARMLKAEYLFAPYKPGSAILTSGDLNFSSSVTVDVTAGVVGGKANVHTNGTASGTGCSQTVNGTVTATSGYGVCGSVGDTGSGKVDTLESVPEIRPSFLYRSAVDPIYAGAWYDLCPDGTVRRGATTPCAGSLWAGGDVSGGGTFRGWSFAGGSGTTAPLWSMTSSSWGPGIYYVYRGDAELSRNTTVSAATVIAEGAPSGGPAARCGMKGGRITAKLVGIQSAALPGVVFVADDDLIVTSNFAGGVGLFGAGNQIALETSSNGITGTVIANDRCTAGGGSGEVTSNEVKNAVVNYDKNVEVPLLDIIRTTQWLELKAT